VLTARGAVVTDHAEPLFEQLSALLEEARRYGIAPPLSVIHEQARLLYRWEGAEDSVNWLSTCDLLTGYLRDVLTRLSNCCRESLDTIGIQAFNFGHCIEQGRYRQDVFAFAVRPRGDAAPAEPVAIAWGQNTEQTESDVEALSTREILPGELPPPEGWVKEVPARWTEMDLPGGDLPSLAPRPGAPLGVSEDTVRRLELVFCGSAVAGSGNDASRIPPRPGYLGIILDADQHELGREGYDERIPLRPIQFHVARLLIENGSDFSSNKRFERAWHSAGRRSGCPSPRALADEIGDLRNVLRRFGLDIPRGRTGLGYRITVITDQPEIIGGTSAE
jgi:hypothetical protein